MLVLPSAHVDTDTLAMNTGFIDSEEILDTFCFQGICGQNESTELPWDESAALEVRIDRKV